MLVIPQADIMLPLKIKALNGCCSDESNDSDDEPVKITKEALETKAELQYSQALQYLAVDKLDEAEEKLSELLESEIISSLNTTLNQKDKSQSVLVHLKYCCLTNLGNLLLKKSKYHEALIHYQEALVIDNTDLNLWYRIGLTHTKLYQTDQAISAFLEGIKCNPNHWPTLDKLITLLYASNEYICCLYHISISLNLDSGYLKGHFIKDIIFKKFPSLISYFKSYCSDGGLDVKCTEVINIDLQNRILQEIDDIKKNDSCSTKISINMDCKPILYAKHTSFKSWTHIGKWMLKVYDNIFENYEHSLLYEPIEFNFESISLNKTKNHIIVDEKCDENDFEDSSIKIDVLATKRRKSTQSISDQLKLSRRSARNKTNSKVNESSLVKSVWDIMPQHLMVSKDGSDKLNINSIKWTDDSMDTMDIYRLYEFSDMLSDGHTENLLRNNLTDEERFKQISDDNYYGSDSEEKDVYNFTEVYNEKSISDLLSIFLIKIANKWSKVWPTNMIQVYINVFKRVWIHTEKHQISYISDSNDDSLNDAQVIEIKDEIISILTYGEILCDLYFQLKISHKPLEGSIIGGEFCSLWIGSIQDALLVLEDKNNKDNHVMINIRFLWLKALFNLQDRETGCTCDLLNMLLNLVGNLNDYEIILPNLEYFYRINKRIAEKLIITLKRNYLLNTIENLYKSKEYLNVVNILKETLKPQNRTFMEIPSYRTMTRYNQYIFLLNSFLNLKNYYELFKWCEPSLHEAIIHYRKILIEESDSNEKSNQVKFINNIFYAMLESIKIVGLNVFDSLSQGYKSRLIQSVINLLSYLIESPDANPEIDAVSPWLLIYSLLKYEESKTGILSIQATTIPQSLKLLFMGHEYLGKRSWCCFEDGILLFLTLSEIEPYIHFDFYTISLAHQVDQIFYCLYTHLMKRNNRPRNINVQEHHSMGLALTWPRAKQLVRFYQPLELPTYDNNTFTVNSDTEAMLIKIIAFIPEECKPNRLLDDLTAYIKGDTSQLPVNNNLLPDDVKDIFYLLADYNFKIKMSWGKAIHYYLLDICNNFDRFDSWAAMALARGKEIETKLNSAESIKNESGIIKKALMTSRCYKHSLKFSPENTTLLIEYGTFTYSIHSFCSRLLKQETSNMSLQWFGELEKVKEKMIKIAKKCFETANNVWDYTDCDSQDERWVHHYILGKIAEKNNDDPSIFMDHYLKAAKFLHSYGAEFPEHISLYKKPSQYSIEVVEVYYRIHAGALKLLEKHDNISLNKELFLKIKLALDKTCNTPIFNENKKNSELYSDIIKDRLQKDDIEVVVKHTLNNIINYAINFETESDDIKIVSYQNFYNDGSKHNESHISIKTIDILKPMKEIELSNDLSYQDINFRWTLIQRCLAALEDCTKRISRHYKSYYRLANFYFRSPIHKNHKKFRDIMFGEQGLFVERKPNNFFHGIWRIQGAEIDRSGSFAYHMSRCIHLLLDFLKETGDHKMLLDLAINLKWTPDVDKKYLRDNEREDISKEALFLSIQILRRLKSEYAKDNRSKNELLLIQVYKSYKRVFKCWQQKDNNLSKLLLNVYQNIVGTKDDVNIEVIVKYCQKLQTKEKEIVYKSSITDNENNFSPVPNSKSTYKLSSMKSMPTPQLMLTPQSISNTQSVLTPQPVSTSQSVIIPQSVSTPKSVIISQSVSTPKSVMIPQSTSTPKAVVVPQSVSTSIPVPISQTVSTPKSVPIQLPVSTPLSIETQSPLYSQQISRPSPLNTHEIMSNQISSMLDPYAQSPMMYSMPQEMCSYTYSLQQKLQATKQKLKKNNQKIEKRINSLKYDINRSPYGRPKKSPGIRSNEIKIIQNQKSMNVKPTKQPKSEFDKSLIISQKFNEPTHNFGSAVEVIKLSPNNLLNQVDEGDSPTQKSSKISYDKPKTAIVKQTMAELGIVMSKVKPTSPIKTTINPRNQKSVYIDLDSVVEQVRLKSSIVQQKLPEKKTISSVPLNPAMLLSSCPGLSITPIISTKNTNHQTNELSVSRQIQNTSTKPINYNLEQLHHLGSLTITKSEKKRP